MARTLHGPQRSGDPRRGRPINYSRLNDAKLKRLVFQDDPKAMEELHRRLHKRRSGRGRSQETVADLTGTAMTLPLLGVVTTTAAKV